jgi:cold shock protein
MPTGTVIIFNDINGEGFIEPDDFSGKIFVSYSEIQNTGYKILTEGQRVTYEVTMTSKGKTCASNVIPAK